MKFYSVYIRKYEKCKEAKELKQNRWIFSIAVLLFFSLPFTAYGEENSDATSGPGVELWKSDGGCHSQMADMHKMNGNKFTENGIISTTAAICKPDG